MSDEGVVMGEVEQLGIASGLTLTGGTALDHDRLGIIAQDATKALKGRSEPGGSVVLALIVRKVLVGGAAATERGHGGF